MLRRLRALSASPDAWLALLAIVLALPTLSYVFGRDTANHYYVARWWLEGYVPYRDTFHDKQPMLYLTHLLGMAAGGGMVGIRVVDLVATLILGAMVVLAVPRGGVPPARGEIGAGMLLAVSFYFGTFDFFDTAHPEYWQAIWLLGAWVAARQVGSLPRAAFISGELSSIAVLYKPTAAIVAIGIAAVVLARAWRSSAALKTTVQTGAMHLAGGLVPVLCFAAYFAATGALGDWYVSTVAYPSAYSEVAASPGGRASLLDMFWLKSVSGWVVWFAVGWGAWMASAWQARDRIRIRAGVEAVGLLILAIVTVPLQRKYYIFHWGLALPFMLQCGALGLAVLAERGRRLALTVAIAASFQGLLMGPIWPSHYYAQRPLPQNYRDYSVAWLSNPSSVNHRSFVGAVMFDYRENQAIADWINERATPQDGLVVRGYEPVIYTLTDLRCPTRFHEDASLHVFGGSFHLTPAWLEEYEQTIARARPRFIVTKTGWLKDDLRRFAPLGYHEAFRHGPFVVLSTDSRG